ncbi:MAG: hypothetical protein ABIS21_06190 [Acidimicrobiales bacterium]
MRFVSRGIPAGNPAGRVVRRTAGAMFLLVYAWWAVSRPPFSGTATAAVLLAGGAAVVLGACEARRGRPEIEVRRGPVAWAVLAAAGGLWELAAYLQHPRDDHPTLSSLANALLDSQPTRAAGFVLWILATVELSRR